MNIPDLIPSEITLIGLIIFISIFIYESFGWKSLILFIPLFLYNKKINFNKLEKKNKELLNSDYSNFLYILDNYNFSIYKKYETEFFNILDELKLFKNNKKYYKTLLVNNKKNMDKLFSSFSLSTYNIEESEQLNKIYNEWYDNIQSIIDSI